MTPEEFADIVLHRRLRVSDVYVGEHFAFGRGRAGRIADLVRYGRTLGFTVHPVKPVMLNGERREFHENSNLHPSRAHGRGGESCSDGLTASRERSCGDAEGTRARLQQPICGSLRNGWFRRMASTPHEPPGKAGRLMRSRTSGRDQRLGRVSA